MGLLIAPYNTAMRLGQGFNSYTHEICIDDAVIVDPGRPFNALTNDGSTMADLRNAMKKGSPYSDIKYLSPTEYELLGISEGGDAAHDKDPKTESDTESESEPEPKKKTPPKVTGSEPSSDVETGDENSGSEKESSPKAQTKDADSEPKAKKATVQPTKTPGKNPASPKDTAREKAKNEDDASDSESAPNIHAAVAAKATTSEVDSDDDSEPETTKTPVKPTKTPVQKQTVPSKKDAKAKAKIDDDTSDSESVASTPAAPAAKESSSEADSDDSSEPQPKKTSTQTTKQLEKEVVAKKLTKEELAEARKEAAFKKKREQDDKKQEEAREEAKKKADRRQEEAEKRARAAADGVKPYTKAERDALFGALTKQVEAAEKQTTMDGLKARKTRQYVHKSTGAKGPSQIVQYSSSFIEKLSDVTDDMSISGALSIKYGNIGGSGRGAFVNSEKFKDSDLNFYISVKVVNQTINMKDALVYQPLRTVDSNNFREVYGDSFISGFIEGGEFNAIVSMKVHNKAQLMNIEAEAKVALTVGVADISAEAAVKVAKKNISNNTETTIMVSWSGGGFIKPIDEPWDIESLMSAAARFPDLVAITPQRTYAILTKYETLRSFVKLKPEAFSPMAYENAQLYTNTLLDVFMDYKTLHKKLGSWSFDVDSSISKLEANPAWGKEDDHDKKKKRGKCKNEDGAVSYQALTAIGAAHDLTPFPVSLGGLDMAKKACRIQMTRIVNEVDAITKNPALATHEDRVEPFMPYRLFKERLPIITRLVLPPAVPLRLEQLKPGFERAYPQVCPDFEHLEDSERLSLTELERERPTLSRFFRLTKPVGSAKNGIPFNNVDFLRYDTYITGVQVEVYKGVVSYIEALYSNGLVARHGGRYDSNATTVFKLEGLSLQERIIAATVETGKVGNRDAPVTTTPKPGEPMDTSPPVEPRITRLKLYTNRGRLLAAQDVARDLNDNALKKSDRRGPQYFNDLTITHFDPIMDNSYIKGFWGYSNNGPNGMLEDGIWRLGFVWGNNVAPEIPPTEEKEDDKAAKVTPAAK